MKFKNFEQVIANQKVIFYPGAGQDFETLFKLHYNLINFSPVRKAKCNPELFKMKSTIHESGSIPILVDYMGFEHILNIKENEDLQETQLNDFLSAKVLETETIEISNDDFKEEKSIIFPKLPKLKENPALLEIHQQRVKGLSIKWEVFNSQENIKEMISMYYFLATDLTFLAKTETLKSKITGLIFSHFPGWCASPSPEPFSEDYFFSFIYPIGIPNWVCSMPYGVDWPCFSLANPYSLPDFDMHIQTPSTVNKNLFEAERIKWAEVKAALEKERDDLEEQIIWEDQKAEYGEKKLIELDNRKHIANYGYLTIKHYPVFGFEVSEKNLCDSPYRRGNYWYGRGVDRTKDNIGENILDILSPENREISLITFSSYLPPFFQDYFGLDGAAIIETKVWGYTSVNGFNFLRLPTGTRKRNTQVQKIKETLKEKSLKKTIVTDFMWRSNKDEFKYSYEILKAIKTSQLYQDFIILLGNDSNGLRFNRSAVSAFRSDSEEFNRKIVVTEEMIQVTEEMLKEKMALIKKEKATAIKNQKYEGASKIREREKELINKLEQLKTK